MTPEGVVQANENIEKILSERSRVAGALGASSAVVHIFPSDANFLLVQVEDARGLVATMARSGIKIRDRSALAGTENSVRISIGTPDENNAMLAVLNQYAAETS
ncbi:hypothetical protein [Nocardia brasiliensis]|uniref:hypothetical protein n=1 Tax=Nocardia brasiliensis TaxID=37326 RepID=UPI0024549605|nr:hypothetical protein [Nocardia brasiliensis]